SIPFKYVYHEGPFGSARRDEIVDARHAEVLVPDQLTLEHVRAVVCRSAPERETLLNLLNSSARETWEPKVILESSGRFFHNRGTFLTQALLQADRTQFSFFVSTHGPEWLGPFDLMLYCETPDGRVLRHHKPAYTVGKTPLAVRTPRTLDAYT